MVDFVRSKPLVSLSGNIPSVDAVNLESLEERPRWTCMKHKQQRTAVRDTPADVPPKARSPLQQDTFFTLTRGSCLQDSMAWLCNKSLPQTHAMIAVTAPTRSDTG